MRETSTRTKLVMTLAVCLTTSAASGCATIGLGTSDACERFEPVYVSEESVSRMSPTTVEAVLEHNEAYEAACP